MTFSFQFVRVITHTLAYRNYLGAAPIPYIQDTILNLPNPYLSGTIVPPCMQLYTGHLLLYLNIILNEEV